MGESSFVPSLLSSKHFKMIITNELHNQLVECSKQFDFDKNFLNNTIRLNYSLMGKKHHIILTQLTKSHFLVLEDSQDNGN